MKWIISAVVLAATATFATGGAAHASAGKEPVSREQYRTLINQCRYAETKAARQDCRAEARKTYTIGAWNPTLNCRTYSSVTVCGRLHLSDRQRACVRDFVQRGLTYDRSEVECYAFLKHN
ncbi:hypothetical protein [Actinomadura miaoliensis]|uniref:Uncharacterized protein n=1 Tax=Actinomadura miaoliensis TaxID=430685 RepID=A0ABP7V022_9ACTN